MFYKVLVFVKMNFIIIKTIENAKNVIMLVKHV